jgi:CheY-like chemotaxis protein
MEREGVAEKKAKNIVDKDSKGQVDWVRYMFDRGPWDETLYDMVIRVPSNSIDSAVDLISANTEKKVLGITPQSRKAASDFILTAQVYLRLAKKWPEVEVSCEDGDVTLLVNKEIVRLASLKKKLGPVVNSVPGVKSVETRLGPKSRRSSIYPGLDFELPAKVLLVDDEKDYVDTLSERLLAREVESAVAYNGEEALSSVEEDEPDVMVLDLKMPGIDGMDVLRKVKKERPNVEVIVLTGHGSEKDNALAKELGAFAYLEKPVDIDILTQTMKEAYRKIQDNAAAAETEDMPPD